MLIRSQYAMLNEPSISTKKAPAPRPVQGLLVRKGTPMPKDLTPPLMNHATTTKSTTSTINTHNNVTLVNENVENDFDDAASPLPVVVPATSTAPTLRPLARTSTPMPGDLTVPTSGPLSRNGP